MPSLRKAVVPAIGLVCLLSSTALAAIAPPAIVKSYNAVSIKLGQTTTLQFVVTNSNATPQFLTGVAFNDTLPPGLQLNSVDYTFSCGPGVIATTPGSISLTGAIIGYVGYIGGNTCTIGVTVQGIAVGKQINTTGTVTSNEGAGNTAQATINVVGPPQFTKAFNTKYLQIGQTTPLQFTIVNPNSIPLTGVNFTDTFPAGLKFVSLDYTFGCDGGVISTSPTSVNLTNAKINEAGNPAGNQCVIGVSVQGTVLGAQNNVSSTVTSVEADPGAAAVAGVIVVGDGMQVTYAGNLSASDAVFNFSNAGMTGGTICANIYAFSPDEQLISCCACPITPNGLASLSVRSDILSNTLTPAVPSSIVVKVLATNPKTCNAANPGPLAAGLVAWGSNSHSLPAIATTEMPFISATLSNTELTRITALCTFIQSNGSGFGICKSCRSGALGGSKK